MKLGVLGGFFNPPHRGHTALGEAAAGAFGLDRVLLIPSAAPPHKSVEIAASPEERLEMCGLAAAEYDIFEVCDWEIKRGGTSYTIDTLEYLSEKHPGAELYLICGGDMFMTVHNWRRSGDIFKLAVICGAVRGEISPENIKAQSENIEKLGGRAEMFEFPPNPVSSTLIREYAAAGKSIREFTGGAVAKYIEEKRLF